MAILTETQIAIAAKKYCEVAGLDPEKLVQAPSPTDDRGWTLDVCVQRTQWQAIAESIREQNRLDEAIRYAASM